MPTEQHKKAAQAFTNAAKHHNEAASQYEKGDHSKGAESAYKAKGFKEQGKTAAREAATTHADKYGNK